MARVHSVWRLFLRHSIFITRSDSHLWLDIAEAARVHREKGGVISYSSDGGSTWSLVYHNPKVRKINAFSVVDAGRIWAVGDD